jgi:hypothetical protein
MSIALKQSTETRRIQDLEIIPEDLKSEAALSVWSEV